MRTNYIGNVAICIVMALLTVNIARAGYEPVEG